MTLPGLSRFSPDQLALLAGLLVALAGLSRPLWPAKGWGNRSCS